MRNIAQKTRLPVSQQTFFPGKSNSQIAVLNIKFVLTIKSERIFVNRQVTHRNLQFAIVQIPGDVLRLPRLDMYLKSQFASSCESNCGNLQQFSKGNLLSNYEQV